MYSWAHLKRFKTAPVGRTALTAAVVQAALAGEADSVGWDFVVVPVGLGSEGVALGVEIGLS